jgi:hypothetical protein
LNFDRSLDISREQGGFAAPASLLHQTSHR